MQRSYVLKKLMGTELVGYTTKIIFPHRYTSQETPCLGYPFTLGLISCSTRRDIILSGKRHRTALTVRPFRATAGGGAALTVIQIRRVSLSMYVEYNVLQLISGLTIYKGARNSFFSSQTHITYNKHVRCSLYISAFVQIVWNQGLRKEKGLLILAQFFTCGACQDSHTKDDVKYSNHNHISGSDGKTVN
jgi:hypothetical protein